MSESPHHLLEVNDLVSGYGNKTVLNGVQLRVGSGELVALIGRNGAGKSTLLKSIFGLIPIWGGNIMYEGSPLNNHNPRKMLAVGISYVPQGNRVFNNLTVRENIELASISGVELGERTLRIKRVIGLFPELEPRWTQMGGTLSSGEKQMLALANAVIISPRLLLLDEPSLGLAPARVVEVLTFLRTLCESTGAGILVVEQKVREVLKVADRTYVMRNGVISHSGDSAEFSGDEFLKTMFLT